VDDGDADALADCADPECDGQDGDARAALQPCQLGRETICDDAFDNDRDLLGDCSDPDCQAAAPCTGELCNNGVDDLDGDGLVDCADPECDGRVVGGFAQECEFGHESSCDDSFDNDRDLLTDCADGDCASFGTETDCADLADDASDCDFFEDCSDPDCAGTPPC